MPAGLSFVWRLTLDEDVGVTGGENGVTGQCGSGRPWSAGRTCRLKAALQRDVHRCCREPARTGGQPVAPLEGVAAWLGAVVLRGGGQLTGRGGCDRWPVGDSVGER